MHVFTFPKCRTLIARASQESHWTSQWRHSSSLRTRKSRGCQCTGKHQKRVSRSWCGKYRQIYIGKYAQIYTQIYTQIYATPSLTSNNYDDAGFQILKPVTERSYLGSASVLSSKALFVCLFFFKGLGSLWGYQIFVAGLANHAGYYECIQINNPKVLTHVHCIALCCVVSCRFALRCVAMCCLELFCVLSCCIVSCRVVSCRVVTTCYTACQVIMVLCFV